MSNRLKQSRLMRLFCPGPVHVAPSVKAASQLDMCHREEEFSALLSELNENTLTIFEIKKKNVYYPVFITGSSTSANETVISAIAQKKNALVITNGEFGDRLYKITKHHNRATRVIDFGWANEIDPAKVKEAVKKYKIKVVIMAHHETSTGMLNPVKEIGKIAFAAKALFFVDAVSSIGADELEVENSHITFCTTASGKAIGSFPGTSIVVGKISEFEKLKNMKPKAIYLNLYNFYHYSKNALQTPNTPNVSGFLALNQAIRNILDEGVEVRRAKVKRFAEIIRRELGHLGLHPVVAGVPLSNILTTFKKPVEMTVTELQARLRDKGIVIYGGKGPLKDKVFQVANIGDIDIDDVKYVINAFKEILIPSHSRFEKAHLDKSFEN